MKKNKYKNFFEEAEKLLGSEKVKNARKWAAQKAFHIQLAELRKKLGLKQVDIKGFQQTDVSKLENRNDMKLSTLTSYLKALGYHIQIKAIPDKRNKNHRDEIILLTA